MTVTTFYSDPGNGGSVKVDGRTANTAGSWASSHDAASGNFSSINEANTDLRAGGSAQTWAISRLHNVFDTSAIADTDTIDSAIISFAGSGSSTTDTNSTDIVVTSATLANNNDVVTGDFDGGGSTEFVTTRTTYSGWNTTDGTYNDMTLNSSGLSNISTTGDSVFMVRAGRDFDDSAPTGDNLLFMRHADTAGTTSDPKLVVTHSEAAATGGFMTTNTGYWGA